jgi:tetratricopeptide (TPR) repeat protein
MSRYQYTLEQCQLLVESVFKTFTLELSAAEFVEIARQLLGNAVSQFDIRSALQSWMLFECEPVQIRGKSQLSTADLADDGTRDFLALALSAQGFDLLRLGKRVEQHVIGVEQIANMLNIDTSTLYRIVRQTRARLAQNLHSRMASGVDWYAGFVRALFQVCAPRQKQPGTVWHQRQAALREVETNGLAMAWHLAYAGDWDDLVVRLHRRAYEIAIESHTSIAPTAQAQLEWFAAQAPSLEHASRLFRVLASVHDAYNDAAARLASLETALRLAIQSKGPHCIANAYLDLARYYSGRNADKAEGLFRICIEMFEQVDAEHDCAEDYCYGLIQYALFQTLKYNSTAIGLMRRAERLPTPLLSQARANLWLEWGTIEWRVGNYAGAIQRYSDAAAIYEGLNDQVNLRTAQFNMGLCHLSMGHYENALRSINLAVDGVTKSAASNATIANWLVTRADCLRQLDEFEPALAELLRALTLLNAVDDPRTVAQIFDLIARIHLRCFNLTGRIEHQLECSNAAVSLYALADRHPYIHILASKLREDLAAPDLNDHNQSRFIMTNPEHAANFTEITEIDRLREQTIAADTPDQRLNARLGISRIYLELSIKERQAALDYAEQHNLVASTTEAVLAMADRHERTLDSRDRLIARWQEHSGLDVSTIQAVLAHFERDGQLTKKAYIALTSVSAATASRVLARLAAAGLIVQQGAGAQSHYTRG